MAALLIEAPGRSSRIVRLFRPLTTIGKSPDCDVSIEDAGLEATHAEIRRDGEDFVIVGMLRDMVVNGRREKQTILTDRASIRIGELSMSFFVDEASVPRAEPEKSRRQPSDEAVHAYRRLFRFSTELLADAPTERLALTLLDGLIELTGAEKGFLVLLEEGQPQVAAARHIDPEKLGDPKTQLSDSILARVLSTREPLVVDDAQRSTEWSASESVVQLRLHSVLCVPLLDRGEVIGLLYVGNDKLTHVFDESSLEVATVFSAQASLLLSQRRRYEELGKKTEALESELEALRFGSIIGACDSMQDVFRKVRKVASSDVSVIVYGETGTGKELVAREVHRLSPRAKGPFVVINCGAIPEALLESELFGHVRGAFTGAVSDKRGRFQLADRGTLFLDEIGEMPLALQVKLLRALQERVVTPVGGTRDDSVDIRVVAATHRSLEHEIKAGRFREDLFYRLHVVNLALPPLRDRGDDLEILSRYFLAQETKAQGRRLRGFSKPCLEAMRKYRWPGNIRELQNRVKKAVVLADGPLIGPDDIDLRDEDLEEVLTLSEAKERFQRRYIQLVLERNGGNRTRAARELGVDPRTVFRHLERITEPGEDGNSGPEDGQVP